jgi:hypothetical protein
MNPLRYQPLAPDITIYQYYLFLHEFKTRVNLVDKVRTGPSGPSFASISEASWESKLLNIVWAFNNINIEAAAYVPSDTRTFVSYYYSCDISIHLLAMEWPDSWIVLSPLNDNEGWNGGALSRAQKLNVTHLGVIGVGYNTVPVTEAFRKNVEVVAVKLRIISMLDCKHQRNGELTCIG